jgi:murein DD-endopeptidase MepM/ murein hydrolase activator NlpD
MRCLVVALLKGLPVRSSLIIGLAGILLAGCSSSIDRFADYPGKSDNTHTASTPGPGGSSSPDDYIESSTLQGAPARSAGSNPYQPPAYNQVQSYDEPQYPTEPQYDEPAPASGAIVIVEPGQTLYSIARSNGVSVRELAATNKLRAPYRLRAGQRIRIPGVEEARPAANYEPEQQNFSQKASVHTVRSGETLFALGRSYGIHPYKIADYNGLSHDVSLSTGQRIRIPGGKASDRLAAEDSFESGGEQSEPYASENDPEDSDFGSGKSDYAYAPSEEDQDSFSDDVQEQEQTDSMPEEEANSFRWPVKGRIISRFGSKPSGTRNEGINIAVPEGTSVRAAESGVIAYAGNELKGYGNLILIRHEGGWVTAYAHNKQLFVKRGDTVRRGDVIAKAGQTGSVDSPQLHFELRKGATAVDPLKYLTSSQASSY